MRVELHQNFISKDECEALNDWVREGVEKKWLDQGRTREGGPTPDRLTTRLYGDRFTYPDFVLNLSYRVRKFCGVEEYPLIMVGGQNGVVTSYMFPGSELHKHLDVCTKNQYGFATLKCNILTQSADAGADIIVGGQVVDAEVGSVHCYLASRHEHYVTKVEGNTPRIIWMFGAIVPTEAWERGDIKVGAN